MQATPVTTRKKELHLQVIQLQQSTGSLVDELRQTTIFEMLVLESNCQFKLQVIIA